MAKIILTTGGTGGHIFPALAVAQALKKSGNDLLFIGSTYGPEERLARNAGLEFYGLPSRGFLGKGLRAVPAIFDMGKAIFKAMGIMEKFRPDVVAGFGGYASFAPALAAAARKIPLLLQEQNAIAGASNRILSRFAKTICAPLPDTKGFKNINVVVTGNPVRADIGEINPSIRKGRNTRRILVLGGSQGAHALNMFMPAIVDKLGDVEIRHQTGEKDLEQTRRAYAEKGINPDIASVFIDNMKEAYEWADMIFCRAGASTVAEICVAGLPSALVPFPAAIHDHQSYNARILANAGAAELVPEKELDAGRTSGLIRGILDDEEKRRKMASAALGLANADAAEKVAREIEKLCMTQGSS